MPQTNLRKAQRNAAKIGVTVKPSKSKNKKLDVFREGKRLASIGDIRYSDFLQGDVSAERRDNYKKRHEKHRRKIDTPAYFDQILWN